jgi:hypothetical protein
MVKGERFNRFSHFQFPISNFLFTVLPGTEHNPRA